MTADRNYRGFFNFKASRGIWGVVLAGILVSGSCWLNAADEAPATGLVGILPAAVPADLTATIAGLPDNWKDWGTALSAELASLYETKDLDVAGQRAAIATLRGRVATLKKHTADPRYKSILNQLVTLSGGLKRRLDIAEAALDTLEKGPEIRTAKIDAAGRELASAANTLGAQLGKINKGDGWVKYWQVKEVQAAAGDSEKLAATLPTVQSRLKEKEAATDPKVRSFFAKPQIGAYEQAVDGYVSALATQAAPANSPELRKSLAELLAALEQYEELHTTSASIAVRKAFDGVRGASPDGGDAISKAVRSNYLNYNIRLVASEAMLNKFAGQARDDFGPVCDYILGADVSGNQATHSVVSFNLRPSRDTARFDLTVQGWVNASTQGVTPQATIFTQGNHSFTVASLITFDGDRVYTQPARIGISANNTTTGAQTHVPLLNWLARPIAIRKAEEMRGESEAIAASRLQDRVLPEFNAELAKQFGPNGKINPQLAERFEAMRGLNVYPDAKLWSTTETELKFAGRVMKETELGGGDPNPALVLGRGASLLVHETAMNNIADRLEFAGQTLTDEEVKAKLEGFLTQLLGREVKFKEKPAPEEGKEDTGPKTIVFDKADPIRFQADSGALTVTLRAGFKQEGKDDIPTQIVTIPINFSVDMKNVVLEPGSIEVASAEPAPDKGKQFAAAGVIRKKFNTAFAHSEINRVGYVTLEKRRVQYAVTRIRAMDGWLSVTVE